MLFQKEERLKFSEERVLENSGIGTRRNQAILGVYQQFSGSKISNIALYATLSHLTKL